MSGDATPVRSPGELDAAFAALWPLWHDGAEPVRLRGKLTELALQDHAPAAHALARLCFEGIGGVRDTAAAFLWALRSAHGGFPPGAAMAGDFYLHAEPEHRACVRLVERAWPWHEQAAFAGHRDAALAASDACRMGRGRERDFGRAYLLLLIAVGCHPQPPPVTDLLGPSLRTDLDAAAIAEIEARATRLLEELPRVDADPDAYWRLCARSHGVTG